MLSSGHSFARLPIRREVESLPDVKLVKFDGFSPNPKFEEVCAGIDLFAGQGCDGLLAVGGGSAIDVAKCIKRAVLTHEGKSALYPPLVSQPLEMDGTQMPLFAVPTTAGTGSESTRNAVMYWQGVKQTVAHDGLLPDAAILEPSVLRGLPPYQKRCTLMDAVSQAIESWWSVKSTEESRAYARQSLTTVMQSWHEYIFDYSDDAAARVMKGANLSGRAINLSQTTAAHAMSYKVTSLYYLPHGHAVAVCLPEIWTYMLAHPDQCIDPRGATYVTKTFYQIAQAMGASTPIEAIARYRDMMKEMELIRPAAGNRQTELDVLTASVNPLRLRNNPVRLSPEVIRSLYDRILR